jgi:DNA-directed RNA polymerase I subunit RPA34.5
MFLSNHPFFRIIVSRQISMSSLESEEESKSVSSDDSSDSESESIASETKVKDEEKSQLDDDSDSDDSDDSDEDSDSDDSDEEKDDDEEDVKENDDKKDPLKIPPSNFCLPEDDSEYEIWTFRLPVSLDHNALNGIKLSLDKKVIGTTENNGKSYGIVEVDGIQQESFRVLVKEENANYMVPVPIQRHWTLVQKDSLQEAPQTILAPGIDRAPVPVESICKAYTPIPQKSGLKRRWMPSGCPSAESLTKLNSEDSKSKNHSNAAALIQGLSHYHSSRSRKDDTTSNGVSFTKEETMDQATELVSPPSGMKHLTANGGKIDLEKRIKRESITKSERLNGDDTYVTTPDISKTKRDEGDESDGTTSQTRPSKRRRIEPESEKKKMKKEAKRVKKEEKKLKKEKKAKREEKKLKKEENKKRKVKKEK